MDDGSPTYVSRPDEWNRKGALCCRQPCSCNTMPANASHDDWEGVKKSDVSTPCSRDSEAPMQPKTLTRKQSFAERFNRNGVRQLRSVNSVPNGRCLRYLAYKYMPRSQSSLAITTDTTAKTTCRCEQDNNKEKNALPFVTFRQNTCNKCTAKDTSPYQDRTRCPRLFNKDGTPVVRRRPKSTNGPPQLRYTQQTLQKRHQRGRPHSSYEPQRQKLEEVSTTETLDVICTYLKEVRLDKNTNSDSSTSASELNQPDAMKYTREKLKARTQGDLTILLDDFYRQIQMVSEELVVLLQCRHELREQVEMRRVATEQLLRLHTDEKEGVAKRDGHPSIQMGVVLPEKDATSGRR